jgi:hypothetical protein
MIEELEFSSVSHQILNENRAYNVSLSSRWSQPEINIRKCKRLVSLGRNGDAVRALESDGIMEVDLAVLNSLKEKHPEGPIPVMGPKLDPFIISNPQCLAAIKSFPKNSACSLWNDAGVKMRMKLY